MFSRRRFLIPIDIFSGCIEAVRVGRGVALPDTKITLLSVIEGEQRRASIAPIKKNSIERLPNDLIVRKIKYLKEIRRLELMDIEKVEVEVAFGDLPADIICEKARRESIDVIVINSHCRSDVSDPYLGSVAKEVLVKAPCPVLVVPVESNRRLRNSGKARSSTSG
jgi:universal stress protein A